MFDMCRRKLFLTIFVLSSVLVTLLPWRVSAAVTISSFSAKWQGNSVVVNWRTGSELNNAGFNILRSTSASGNFTKVNYTPAQFGSIAGASYSFTDSAVTPGTTYYYRLESIDASGKVEPYSQTASAVPSAAPTATATATRTPTRTAMLAPGAPTSTPAPPTATFAPPTATATPPPQFTPTRTRTLPPGVPSPTPLPPTPTLPRVAYAVQPTAAPPKPGAAPAPSVAAPKPEATSVAVAIKETESDAAEEPIDEEIAAASNENDVRTRRLIFGVMILGMGIMGAGGLVLGIFAIYLAFRPRNNV